MRRCGKQVPWAEYFFRFPQKTFSALLLLLPLPLKIGFLLIKSRRKVSLFIWFFLRRSSCTKLGFLNAVGNFSHFPFLFPWKNVVLWLYLGSVFTYLVCGSNYLHCCKFYKSNYTTVLFVAYQNSYQS